MLLIFKILSRNGGATSVPLIAVTACHFLQESLHSSRRTKRHGRRRDRLLTFNCLEELDGEERSVLNNELRRGKKKEEDELVVEGGGRVKKVRNFNFRRRGPGTFLPRPFSLAE